MVDFSYLREAGGETSNELIANENEFEEVTYQRFTTCRRAIPNMSN